MSSDLEEQEDELLALHSIFTSEEFVRHEPRSAGEVRVRVELPAGFTVALRDGDELRQYELSFLPPLLLTFDLPEDYPSSFPPSFTLNCSWLTHTQFSVLEAHLVDLYKATGGTVVLFSWVQFLREEALSFLGIDSLLELPSNEQNTRNSSSHEPKVAPSELQNNQDTPMAQNRDVSESSENGLPLSSPGVHELVPSTSDRSSTSSSDSKGALQSDYTAENMSKSSDQTKEEHNLSPSSPPPSASSVPSAQSERASSDPTLPQLPVAPAQALLSQLLIHNEAQRQRAFATSVFDCGVCFMSLLGSECVQLLECDHIYCRACLAQFSKVQIAEGNVRGVTCPQPGCTVTLTPSQVMMLVGETMFNRYDRLLLQSTLDTMADVAYCPRSSCGTAVILEEASKAAMCSVCSYAFCVSCRKTYHGEVACQSKDMMTRRKEEEEEEEEEEDTQQDFAYVPQTQAGMQALWDDYSSSSKLRKRLLESRYGRWHLRGTLAECLSKMWVTSNSKHCPHCFFRIQKDGGCNVMTCSMCRQRFCWLCLTRLPYGSHGHFDDGGCAAHDY
ncbi:E3 ubiquitin-protein ligase RNF14-like [Genypterus blacodes]|uniref:E3 ubiquitin-protein ligase RNF14-like n=1 Tax=Genypterus blacodes TaxID=154954 RepID=UPI003F77261E